ncbi:MAG: DMT family transporter [Alphaproteobacteria bacterium]|nr:DMT family transporter [Alphaproteobacteria bacterium]
MSENRSALFLMALSMSLLAAGDAVVRVLGETFSAGQVIALRGVILMMVLAVGLMFRGVVLRRDRIFHKWSVARAFAETASTYCFFISIQLMPIAVSTTVVFIFPVLLTLVSIPLFGEKVGVFRWIAVLMGFLGVLLIAAPGGDGFDLALLLPLGTAFALVARDLITRYIPPEIQAGEVTLTTAVVTTVFGFMSLPFGWGAISGKELALLPLAAILVALSFTTYVMSIRKGELSIIAPAQYLVILWATFWGALIWGEFPDGNAVYGGALIIAAGCLILWREHVQRQRLAATAAATSAPE